MDKKFVWHPYTQMRDWIAADGYPAITRGEGFYLVDENETRYLDGTSSMWCNVWGHGSNPVIKAMQRQLDTLQHSTLFGLSNETATLLARRMLGVAKGMDRVFYTDNGSTAIEAAMKMAVQYWSNRGRPEKKRFLSLKNGYHGDTAGAMSVGYIEKFFGAYKPMISRKVYRLPSPLLHNSGHASESGLVNDCLAKTEAALREHHGDCAALVMESGAQIAGGAIVFPPGYQKEIALLCRKYGVLLILDEIATGFGRLGNMAEYVAQKSTPDIACFGKALTGGYFPLACVVATNEIFNAFLGDYSGRKQFYHGHTFTGHPVGCAAALANMEQYEKAGLIQKIRATGKHISSRLREFARSPLVCDIRHKGMLAGIELEANGKPVTNVGGERINYFIMRRSLEKGVFLRPLGNIMMLVPPLAIGRQDLDKIIDTHLQLLHEIERSVPHSP